MSKAAELAKFIADGTLGSDVTAIKHSGGTSALTIDSSGRVLRPVAPYIYLRGNNAAEVNTKGGGTTYTNWAVEGSAVGGISFDSSNGRFSFPLDGLYLITARFYLWMNTAEAQGLYLRKNGTSIQEYFTDFAAVGGAGRTDHTLTVSEVLDLTTTDYIDFLIDADVYGGNVHSNCQIVMIG